MYGHDFAERHRRSDEPTVARNPGVLLLGTSVPMREVERALGDLAHAEVNLLIQGELGTGKRVLAEAIHRHSPRAREPFHVLSLSGLTELQAEQELFGGEGVGALLQDGSRATLYLEGIEALAPRLQRRLAAAIATGESLAGARIITGSATPLEELVRLGRFRHDLYFQLGVVRLTIPPLRERREDIVAIVEHFTRRWCAETSTPRIYFARAALAELSDYAWPGNARELQQTLEAALAVSRGGEISVERVRTILGRRPRRYAAPDVFPLRQLERDYIAAVLTSCNWNQSLAARRLGIGRNTLMRKIKAFGLGRAEEAA